jgi:hypothetical protein
MKSNYAVPEPTRSVSSSLPNQGESFLARWTSNGPISSLHLVRPDDNLSQTTPEKRKRGKSMSRRS